MSRRLCLIGLGSNLGDRAATLREAFARLAVLPQTTLVSQSALHATTPVGGPTGQGEFLNAAALLETSLPPGELLAALHHVESDLGRVRESHWGPRALDLDLLLYGDQISTTPELTLPHPRMAFRRFVLASAVEIAPDLVHPENGWTVRKLWEHLVSAPETIALVGGAPDVRRTLAERAATETSAVVFCDWNATALDPKLLVRLDDAPPPALFAGPVLKVDGVSFEQALAEIVAAIEAMR